MTSWSLLPTDILDIIFEYVLEYDETQMWNPPIVREDIRPCQQTCKSWAVIAQIHLYKYVELYTLDQAELFIHTLRNYNLGSLVKSIDINVNERTSNIQKQRSLLQQIGYFCPDLKKLEASFYISIVFWKCIQVERSKGAFSKLQVITPPLHFQKYLVTHYYEAAYSLRETLRELTLYVEKSVPIENLENFTNIDTLYFKFNSCADIYTLDQQSKRCSSVEVINIDGMKFDREIDEEYLLMRGTRISSSVRICAQVKHLFVRNMIFDSKLGSYLMDVFPSVNKLELDLYSTTRLQRPDRMSNNTAHRFLSYLMKMSSARVNYFLVEDVDDLLMNFHDINGMNRHLSITYRTHRISYIILEISTKQEIGIEVMNLDGRELFYLPRLGMIEKSGKKFQSLTVNMNKIPGKKLDTSNNGTDLYHILFHCPNMKKICIENAFLPCFSTHEHQRLRLSLHTFEIDFCVFRNSYLRNLSRHVNYINALKIREDVLRPVKKGMFKSRVINMPETEFYSIDYYQRCDFRRIFLRLEKIVDDSVGWYVSKDNGLERCTKEDFEASVRDKCSMSIFICCVDVRVINLDTYYLEVTFKP